MQVLIDGDIIVFQSIVPSHIWYIYGRYFFTKRHAEAYAERKEHEENHPADKPVLQLTTHPHTRTIEAQLKAMVKEIVTDLPLIYHCVTGTPSSKMEPILFIKGDNKNYRYAHINQVPYKANRPPKPRNYEFARAVLAKYFNVEYANGQETDDLLGIIQTKLEGSSIIVSKDKDLLTIPGWNYNPFHKKLSWVTLEEADRNFYTQILTGDRADNIPGLYGIGPVKAKKILKDCHTPRQMLIAVLDAFKGDKDLVDELGKLMRIRRTENEIWSVEEELR